jgi:hypothetical protein
MSVTIVPAPAGYYFLQAVDSDGELCFDAAAIIAWRIVLDEDGELERAPITTAEGYFLKWDESTQAQAVLAPNGRVYAWGDPDEYADRAEWEARMTKWRAKRKATA